MRFTFLIFSLVLSSFFLGFFRVPHELGFAARGKTKALVRSPGKFRECCLYPQGKFFPLGLYSLDTETPEELYQVKQSGWNAGHTYGGDMLALENKMDQSGMFSMVTLEDKDEASTKQRIQALSTSDSVWMWDFPEEQRWWEPEEFNLIKNLSQWTRKYDPKKRPNFMYIPGHYTTDDVSFYVPYLDIIGTGVYPEYMHQPHAWVRYRMEANLQAITKAGFTIGSDYLHGEKTPICIPMLFTDTMLTDGDKFPAITPAAAYHDVYSCLASGARGIVVFSYFHRHDPPGLEKTYKAYSKAASEISGPEGLGQAILFGKLASVNWEITKGPPRTETFNVEGEKMSYPSLNVRGMEWKGSLYIIAVNSSQQEDRVHSVFKNLPSHGHEAKVLFENRTLPLDQGSMADTFSKLGVHVYKIGVHP